MSNKGQCQKVLQWSWMAFGGCKHFCSLRTSFYSLFVVTDLEATDLSDMGGALRWPTVCGHGGGWWNIWPKAENFTWQHLKSDLCWLMFEYLSFVQRDDWQDEFHSGSLVTRQLRKKCLWRFSAIRSRIGSSWGICTCYCERGHKNKSIGHYLLLFIKN